MSDQSSHDPQPPYQPQSGNKPNWFVRHKILTGAGALLLVGVVFGGANGGGPSDTVSTSSDSTFSSGNGGETGTTSNDNTAEPAGENTPAEKTPTQKARAKKAPAEMVHVKKGPAEKAPAEKAPALSAEQENAVGTAEDYLSTSGFSRTGLIEQLTYEGYSKADAAFAADAVHADWNEQAARTAKEYLDTSGFSRSGLIEQLTYDGYTQSQAAYGASQAGLAAPVAAGKKPASSGSATSAAQDNALRTAKEYLSTAGFSRSGLVGQLQYDGYSKADAAFAADGVHADWNQQAVRTAKEYLNTSGFSRSGLIGQLTYDGYTQSQAEYGATQAGL